MRLLAIDPSLNQSGIAYGDGRTETVQPGKLTGTPRLAWLQQQFLCKISNYNPDAVLVEDYSYGSKGSSIVQIAEWGGVLRLLLFGLQVPVTFIPPKCLKQWVTGKGNGDKMAVLSELTHRAGKVWRTTDEAEAWALLTMGYARIGQPILDMPADRNVALKKIAWHPVLGGAL